LIEIRLRFPLEGAADDLYFHIDVAQHFGEKGDDRKSGMGR